ncbi:MAG: hypothetical protein II839_03220 [Kiritimatiellae bacterium]|nr:hypothetical protein [Kiritimatiellia bacterium]
MSPPPSCHVVAGPNGSGKSTVALRYLPQWAGDLPVPPDLWDRLAADARARLADDLLYVEEARRTARAANAQKRP